MSITLDGWIDCYRCKNPTQTKVCNTCGYDNEPGCGYCGQDPCDCEQRYGVVQGIVSRRAGNEVRYI